MFLLHLLCLLLVLLLDLLSARSASLLLCRSLMFLLLLLRELLVFLLLLRIKLLLLLPVLLIVLGISSVSRRGQGMCGKILRVYRSWVRSGSFCMGRWSCARLSCGAIGGRMIRCSSRFGRYRSSATEFPGFRNE